MNSANELKRKPESSATPEDKIKKVKVDNTTTARRITALNVNKFALKRVIEIQALTDIIKDVGGNHQAFQKLPHYMRRRPMSHNIKRVPRRLHNVVKAELDKVKSPNKRPSRKYRRKPSNLLSEYERRKRRIHWLDTHIWHAKRFKMTEAWGYRLPLHPTDKSIRSCYRSVQRHCLLQDVSYEHYIEIEGKRESVLNGLCHLTAKETGPSFAAQMTSSGFKEGSLYMYHYDSYPHNVIGRVTYFWHAENKDKINGGSISKLWICCHPSFGSEALDEIKKCFRKIPSADSSKVSTDDSTKVKNENDATNMDASDRGCVDVSVTSLKHELVKFRLFGPASNSVLRETLKLWDRSELDVNIQIRKIANGNNAIPRSDTGADSEKGKEIWWKSYYQDSQRQEENEKQKEILTRVLGCRSPAEAPPHAILAATVKDPRLLLPPKRNKVSVFVADAAGERLKTEMFTHEISTSPLWNRDVRENVKATKISEKAMNDMKSKHLIPGTQLELGENESRIPVILIQRPGLTDFTSSTGPSSQHQIGYASGWDVVIPAGWAMAFWIAMVYRGARVGGQREAIATALQAKQFVGVRDVPDSTAGKKELETEATVLQTKHDKRPPAKRPNYTKLGVDSPFIFQFDQLCQEWCRQDLPKTRMSATIIPKAAIKEGVYVLRQRKILKMLNEVLVNPKRFLQAASGKKSDQSMSSSVKKSSLLEKVLMTLEGKNLVESHSSALIPVNVSVLHRGVPARNAHLCIPSNDDWNKLRLDKSYGGPDEKLHPDEDAVRRKSERKERLKLRKKKKRGKKVGASGLKTPVVNAGNEKRDVATQGDGSNSAMAVDDSSKTCKFTINKTSRSVVGFVTVGNFDLGQGQGAGMGFCSVKGLLHLISASQSTEGKCLVLVRNPTSLQYRFASISVVL